MRVELIPCRKITPGTDPGKVATTISSALLLPGRNRRVVSASTGMAGLELFDVVDSQLMFPAPYFEVDDLSNLAA
jgi:hypothetical protein